MERREKDTAVETTRGPILAYMGIDLVECTSRPTRDSLQIRIVISRKGGVSIDECAKVHKTLLPRLQASLGRSDINIEVSSPGLTRNIKSSDEFALFTGRGARILVQGRTEWETGVIGETDDSSLTLQTPSGAVTIRFADIQKARLEYIGG